MSFLDKAQTFLKRFRPNSEPSEESMYSRRHDGSLSGYHPNVGRQPQQPAAEAAPYDPYSQPPSPYAQQAMAEQPQQPEQQPEMYTFQQNYQQAFWAPPEQPTYNVPQMDYQAGYQPQFQSPLANQPGSPFVGYQPQFQPQQPAPQPQAQQPQQPPIPDNISYMPGGIIGKDGTQYLHTVRIAQITGVPDCYLLMQSMRNNESVIVNLDLVPDTTEIDRCLDLLFGACYALQCQFNHVSTRNIYLLTPGTVQVENVENLRRQNEYEVDNRWPDPSHLNYRSRSMGREPQNPYAGYAQNPYAASYQSYGGMGRRTGTRNTATEYTDFGGFPNAGRF